MRKELLVVIFVTLMLTLFTVDTTQAVDPDLSVQPLLIQDETMKPLDPPLQSHPTAHQYTAPVTNPTNAYDNNQITYSSTNISLQPYPNVYSRSSAYTGSATVSNPTYAYDLNLNSYAAIDVRGTTPLRDFTLYTFNTTAITTISSLDVHIKYNLTIDAEGSRPWYQILLHVGTKNLTLIPLYYTQLDIDTTTGNWTALPEPNDGLWNNTDVGNIRISVYSNRSVTQDRATFRIFEVWVRAYSPVVQYFDFRTFNPTAISEYSYLSVNINCTIIVGGCSYKILISVGSKNRTLQTWTDVSQLEPDTIAWQSVTEPNDGWWNQTDLANLRIIIETQKTKSVNQGEFRIYEAWVLINPPTVNSYPSNHEGTATISNPTLAYDKNQMTYASISPPSTAWTYFAVKSFNVTTLKEYSTISIQMRYKVTTWNGRYRIYLHVNGKSLDLQVSTNANQTEPTVRTWVGVCEPNDAVWSPADLSNMQIRVEVRKTTTVGTCTFQEYDTWVTIPKDHFTVRAQASGVQVSAQLYAWSFNLTFNPAVLRAVSVFEGPFLKEAGVTNFAGCTIGMFEDTQLGWLYTGSALDLWDLGGVDGTGTLAIITFQAIAEGNSMFNFTVTEMASFNGLFPVPLTHTKSPGWFQCLAGDVNGDAEVNVADLHQLGRAYGPPGSPGYDADADQDKDGDVDGDDLTIVSNNYGAT